MDRLSNPRGGDLRVVGSWSPTATERRVALSRPLGDPTFVPSVATLVPTELPSVGKSSPGHSSIPRPRSRPRLMWRCGTLVRRSWSCAVLGADGSLLPPLDFGQRWAGGVCRQPVLSRCHDEVDRGGAQRLTGLGPSPRSRSVQVGPVRSHGIRRLEHLRLRCSDSYEVWRSSPLRIRERAPRSSDPC